MSQLLESRDAVAQRGKPTVAQRPGAQIVRAENDALEPSRLDRLKAYVSIARPDHWFKNVFMALGVLLAFFYHPEVLSVATGMQLGLAVMITCLLASSNYVINEILDAPTDLAHPVKRHRPIPSGLIWLPLAYLEWIGLGVLGLVLAWQINIWFFASGAFLLVMGMIYNVRPIRAKDQAYVDVLTESINNPIRLLLGWFALNGSEFPPVSLLISYWMIGAFFMASKRFAEYRSLGHAETAGAYRNSFRHYNEEKLLTSMFFYTTCFALFLGIFIIRYKLELILIVPLVAGFIAYYVKVSFKANSAVQNPERLYREKGLMAYLALCVVAFFALMLVQIPALYEFFNVQPSGVSPLWRF